MPILSREEKAEGAAPPRLAVSDLVVDGHRDFVLGPISLSLRAGGALVVLGGPSSGKSLLLLALAGLVGARSGTVHLDGEPLPPALRRRRTGLAFQRDALVPDESALENVARAARGRGLDAPDDRAADTLRRVGIADEHHARAPRALSFGMRRRVGLARALVAAPDVLLLDDPTAGLDPATAREVVRVIREVARDAALVLTTHDVDVVLPTFGDVLVLDAGRTRTSGTAADVLVEGHAELAPRALGGLT